MRIAVNINSLKPFLLTYIQIWLVIHLPIGSNGNDEVIYHPTLMLCKFTNVY